MTPGQLIDLLEKSGMLKEESPGVLGWHPTTQKAAAFAALVAAFEREAVLDLVDGYAKNNTDLADAIRARGNT
jgi:hypothetical protein